MEVGDEDVDVRFVAMRVGEADHWEEGAEEVAEGEFAIDAKAGEDGGSFLRSGCVHGYIIAYMEVHFYILFGSFY